MKRTTIYRLRALLLCATAALGATHSAAEDIDIFTGAGGGTGADPKILIILDNTSNWARQSQQWPGTSLTLPCTFSSSSTTVTTSGNFNTSGVAVGMQVTGAGIATSGSGTLVASIASSGTSLTLSSATTASGSSTPLTFASSGLAQGQSEARAINTVLGAIGSDVNLGLMEFVTGGTANDTGGFIRQAIQPMTDTNKTAFSTQLTTIYNNINDPDEKRNANTPYGDLMHDAYNYFTGGFSVSPAAVLASKADSNGYTANYTQFRSPLSDANSCGRNFVIFIGNPNTNGPAGDSSANGSALTTLGGSISPQIQLPGFTTSTQTTTTNLGYTSQCYASQAVCTTTDFATQCAAGGLYASCSCSNTLTTTSLDSCLSGTQRYSVIGNTITSSGTTTAPAVISHPTHTGTSGCYVSSAAAIAAGDHGGMSLPTQTVTSSTSGSNLVTTTTTYSNDSYTIDGTLSATQDCTPLASAGVLGSNQITTSSATTTACYGGITSGNPKWNASSDNAGLTCPGTTTTTSGDGITTPLVTTTITYTCSYAGAMSTNNTGCSGNDKHVTVTQSATGSPSTVTSTPRKKFVVTQNLTASSVDVTASGATTTPTLLGNTAQCYASTTNIPEFATTCSSYNGGCSYAAPTASAGLCTSGARYMVVGSNTGTVVTPTGTFTAPSLVSGTYPYADEWTRFMHQAHAKNLASGTDTIKQPITTYTIDVFNKQQNADETALYMSMARVGGGKYFAATNEAAIVAALQKIMVEIQSVNTTFASASLPVNATNRTQNANQVFIGMFRPDPDANPRWYGNLKQYQIGKLASGDLDLVDVSGSPATNALTGFIDDCAASFWTTDSSNYWANITVNPDPASNCSTAVASGTIYSDLPDGPTVEKGAVAENLRKGNNPGVTPISWTTTNRNLLTLSGSSVVSFNLGAGGLADTLVRFSQGVDVNNDTGLYNASTNPFQTRPSIHGDVVHSRPLPANYGGTTGVTVFYGANDGALRAVDASNGKERWAFIAPEHYSKLQRLKDNAPAVDYKLSPAQTYTVAPKDYFFDGSIGIYQAAAGANAPVWIFPTMRRGGRMLYAFDVTNPAANPILKWRHGCTISDPTLDPGDASCDAGFTHMGQTWSTPNVAFINGYSTDKTTKPVVVMGGGYDKCEDADTSTPSCGSTKGNVIYFIDADTGNLITSFTMPGMRAVAADVNMIDVNNDGLVDYAYAADTGGNIYRIDFVTSPLNPTALPAPTAINNTTDPTHWFMHKVAFTNGDGRKFLFGPGLFPSGTSNFLAIVSGDREHPLISNYPYKTPIRNRAYVYRDDLTSGPTRAAVDLDDSDVMLPETVASGSTCSSTTLLSDPTKKGWWMSLVGPNLELQGEQGVTSAVIVGGMVTFSTNRPLSSALSCNTRLGEARGYFVNLFNASGAIGAANNASCGGARSSIFAGGGLPPSPVIGIVPINGVPTAILIGAPQRDGGTSSPIKPDKITPPIKQDRSRTYKFIKGDN